MTSLDPQIRAVLDGIAAQPQPDTPPTLDQVRATARAGTIALSPPASEMASITDIRVPGPNGDVRCIVNRPTDDDELPVLLYFHEGGCVLFSADEFNPVCTNLAAEAECIVVNVDFRVAPEHPFPAPLDDSFAVYAWCLAHAGDFGGDAARVAVGGGSGGGYLAAALCLEAKAAGLPQPALQVLIYPQVDMADRSASMISVDAFVNESVIAGLVAAHVGDAVLDPRASPLRAADHGGLAPAFILAAGHDPLLDQGCAYRAILQRSGVPTEYSRYDGMIHAFFAFGGAVDAANDAVAEVASKLREAFAG